MKLQLGTMICCAVALFGAGGGSLEALAAGDAPRGKVLQRLQLTPGKLADGNYYVPATLDTVKWGYLPNRDSKPIFRVPSGSVITFDCLSGEGMMEDQGRDPVTYLGKRGVARKDILDEAVEIAASSLQHDFDKDGPHIILGPVAVDGAEPGDVLKIEIISAQTRVPYGIVTNNHGTGALPGEFPENAGRQPGADSAHPELYNNVATFVPIETADGAEYGMLPTKSGSKVRIPLSPFPGTIGVGMDTTKRVNSVPPFSSGGNMDLKELCAGSTLYVPVQLRDAMLFIGDPHFAQGDGEVALTAIEGSLRVTIKATVLKPGDRALPTTIALEAPFVETKDHWVILGLDPDLDEAVKKAVRSSIKFLSEKMNMDRSVAYAYLSAAADFHVTQVVDRVKGIHALIRKRDFPKESR